MIGVIDSHCHLQSLPPEECERALDDARERGVRGFMVPAVDLDDVDRLLALCERHDDVWCALGVHPHAAKKWRGEEDVARLRDLLGAPGVVAVGECGLDFFYDNSPREAQFRALRDQWRLALELDLPVVVHNRDSNDEMLEVVREPEFKNLRGDFHSFAGGAAMGSELLDRGFYLGLSGMITFPRADNVREVIPRTPESRLLVETDTPYLAPVPYRGKPNRPAYVVEVLDRLASELGSTPQMVADRTSDNFFRLFDRAAPADA
ncbi:MAG: TatD family hydrolase [Acidobacteriota bacterium]